MNPQYSIFVDYLNSQNKEACVDFVLTKLGSHEIDITTLYTNVLTPSLNEPFCESNEQAVCIWQEHARSSIIRTIIECCYPYVVRERNDRFGSKRKGKAVVVCPTEELHELGARMVADFFTLAGFDAIFVGANTPQDDILESIDYVRPDYITVSVSATYNLVAGKRTIGHLRSIRDRTGARYTIIVGGHAFARNPGFFKESGADMYLESIHDIFTLEEGA